MDQEMEKRKMNFDEYQKQARTTADYPGRGSISGAAYAALGLAGEAGETANKVKKIIRDDALILTDSRRMQLKKEIGDCLWYTAALADELGLSLADIAAANLENLANRVQSGTLHGDGDNR